MTSPRTDLPQFVAPRSKTYQSAAQRREALGPSPWPAAMLIAFFLGWLALSVVILATNLIEPPGRGIFFRLCLLATPFALGAGVAGFVLLVARQDRIR